MSRRISDFDYEVAAAAPEPHQVRAPDPLLRPLFQPLAGREKISRTQRWPIGKKDPEQASGAKGIDLPASERYSLNERKRRMMLVVSQNKRVAAYRGSKL
jgi:hypothetical protein